MYVIRLPNGNLRVPQSALSEDGRVIGQGYVEITPADSRYRRLAEQAITEEELAERRSRWRAEDEALLRQFEEFRAQQPEE